MEKKRSGGRFDKESGVADKTTQSLQKKLTTLLEKRKIEGFETKLQKGKIILTLPTHFEADELDKLTKAIMEIPGSENIKISSDAGPKKMMTDGQIEDEFGRLVGRYIPKEKNVSGSVRDGVMTVYGTVSSAHARDALLDIAKEMPSVKKVVDATKLPEAKGDVELSNLVMLELGHEPNINVFHLQVMARNGIAFITGNARDDKSVKLTTDVVSKVPGVKTVENAIKMHGEGLSEDDKLRDAILVELLRTPNVRARDIKVTVVHGHVFLRGYAATTKEIVAAESLVSGMKGVKKVYMELEPRL